MMTSLRNDMCCACGGGRDDVWMCLNLGPRRPRPSYLCSPSCFRPRLSRSCCAYFGCSGGAVLRKRAPPLADRALVRSQLWPRRQVLPLEGHGDAADHGDCPICDQASPTVGRRAVRQRVGPAGFSIFLGALVVNSLYPSVLLRYKSAKLQRDAVAAVDVILDLIYSATSSVAAILRGHHSAQALPHDPWSFASSFYPVMHILTVAHAMENAKRNQTEYPERTVSRRASVGFAMTSLSVVLVVLFTQCSYGNPFHPPTTCAPCYCDAEHTLHSCKELEVLHLSQLDLDGQGHRAYPRERL